MFRARLLSLSYKILVFLYKLYVSEQYLSCSWHSLFLSSTSFTRSIKSYFTFSPALLTSFLYWRDLFFSRISLLDKIIFLSQRLKNKFVSQKIASNHSNVNFWILNRNFFLVMMTNKGFQIYWFKNIIHTFGSE